MDDYEADRDSLTRSERDEACSAARCWAFVVCGSTGSNCGCRAAAMQAACTAECALSQSARLLVQEWHLCFIFWLPPYMPAPSLCCCPAVLEDFQASGELGPRVWLASNIAGGGVAGWRLRCGARLAC